MPLCLIVCCLLQNTPPFNIFVLLDAERNASAKFEKLVQQHEELVQQRDTARSKAKKASDLVKTAKATRDKLANVQPVPKSKSAAASAAKDSSKDVSKKRSRSDNCASLHKKKKRKCVETRKIKGKYPPAGYPAEAEEDYSDHNAQEEDTTTNKKPSKKKATKTKTLPSNNADVMCDNNSLSDNNVDSTKVPRKKSATKKQPSNNADIMADKKAPSDNDVHAANVPNASTNPDSNTANAKASSQPPKFSTAASSKSNLTSSGGKDGGKTTGESAHRKKRLPMNTRPSNIDPTYPCKYL